MSEKNIMKIKYLASTKSQNVKSQLKHSQTGFNQKGSVLLEALIAILIFSFGILAIAGLQGAMMKNTADATYRAEASYVVQQYLGSMIANPYGFGQGMVIDLTTQPTVTLPNGKLYVDALSGGRLRFRVTWKTHGVDAGAAEVAGGEKHQYEAITSIFTAR
jgi:type IV pilus assembly protein PilV